MREAGVSARKALGQHFLTSTSALRRIADATELTHENDVIEVGAGLGALTAELASRARRVIAIELDDDLARYLERRFSETNVTVHHGDALEFDPAKAISHAGVAEPYVVTGNLPYRISQPLLRHFLEAQPPARRLVVMVQAEVAKSIVSTPGQMTLLGVSVQLFGEPRILFRLPRTAFYPPPKVRSAVIRIDISPRLRADIDDKEAFFRVVRAGFGTRRKQLRNSLAGGLRIPPATAAELITEARLDGTRRPQELSLDAWAALSRAWQDRGSPEDVA